MSHITLLQYITQLQNLGLTQPQISAAAEEWKKTHTPKKAEEKVEVVKEIKVPEEGKQPAVAETGTTVAAETNEVSEPSDSGDGELVSQEIKPGEFAAGMTDEQLDATRNYQKQYENVAKTNEEYSPEDNSFKYKFEVTPENKLAYYYKGPNDKDFVLQEDEYASVKIGQIFNHYDKDQLEIIKGLDKQKALEKDLKIGDTLVDAKLDAPVTEVEEAGRFLTIEEIEAKRKNQKARIAFGIEDLDLDQKISDEIYDENLDVDDYYSQFKDDKYTGEYSYDLNEDIAKIQFNKDFNSREASNFLSSEDFLGFLNEEGLMNDYLNNYYGGQFGKKGFTDVDVKLDPEEYKTLELARQRKLDNYFNLYIQDTNNKHNKQVLLSYIVNNKDKFKEAKTLSEAVNMAEKILEEKYDQSYFPKIDYSEYKAFREKQFPQLVQAEKELQAARQRKSKELIEEGSSEGLLQDNFTKFYRGVMGRAQEQAYEIRDLLGYDTGVGRNLDAEENIKQSFDQVRYGYVEGKTAEIDDVDYIKDDEGNIYNTTSKIVFVPSSEEELKKVSDILDASKERASSFSSAGSTEQFFATAGTMLFDISQIYSVGKVTKATKLGKLAQAVRIPKASFDAATYYTMAGYVSTKKNTFEELIASGVNEIEAAAIAEETAKIGGVWMGATSFIAPTTTYMKQFNKFLGNKNALQSALKGYKKSGPKGFINNFKTTLKNLKPTKEGVIKTLGASGQEFGQEEFQQLGEFGIVNAYANRIAGEDILKEDFTRQDFINTGIVSFASGGAFSNLNIPGFKPSATQQLNNLYTLGQDLKTTQQLMNEAVANGDATQEEVGKVMKGIRSVKNQMSRIPANVSAKTKLESARLQQDISDLQAKKKRIDEAYHSSIDSQIDAKKKELAEVVKVELEKAQVRKGAKKILGQLGVGFENFTTQQDMDSAAESLKEDGWEVQDSAGYGMALTKGNEKVVLSNDQVSAEDNKYTTDQHEVLHPFWQATFAENPEVAIKFGKSLIAEIINNKDILGGSELISRLQSYLTDPDYSAANTWEEVIPLVSESLANGDIVYNKKQEGFWKSLRNSISNVFKKKDLNITFDTGLDVFNFLQGYNDTIQGNKKLTEQQLKVAKEGATGALVDQDLNIEGIGADVVAEADILMRDETEIKKSVAKESKRVEDSQEVQRLYDEQGVSAAMDIIEKFKPITSKIVEARSQAPNFDRQLLTDEIETGKRGILDLVMEYKPESGVPLAAYINKFLPARAIEASQRVLGEEFTTDVTEAKGVVTEEVTEIVEEKPTKLTKPSSLLPAEAVTEITEQVKEKIKGIDPKSMTFKKLGDLAPEVIAREIGIPVKKLTDPRANLSKGDATAIQQFVNKNADKLLRILPEGSVTEAATDDILGTSTGVPTGLLKAFYTKGKRSTRGAGLTPFIKNKNISKADFLEAFGIVEGKKAEGFSARSPQAQALKGIASLYGRLVSNEVSRSPEVGLKPEAKQRVAAGKAKTMASKRIESQEGIETNEKLNNLFLKAIESKNKNQLGNILDYDSPAINAKNRPTLQANMLEAVKKYKLDTATIQAGMMASGGKQTFYGKEGGKMYSSAKMAKKAGVKDFIKFGKTTDGKFLPIKTKGVDNWVARPGRLYYGETDPVYKTLLKAAKKYDGPKPKKIIPSRAFSKNKKTRAQALQESKDNMEVLDHVVNQLADAVADDMPLEIAGFIITQSYQATGGLIKISAPFKYRSKVFRYGPPESKKQQREGKKFREEHNPPASVVGSAIMFAIKTNAANPIMQAVKSNYYQTQLSKFDDALLDKASLDANLVKGQTIFDNPISRLAAAGIDLQSLVSPFTSETIAQENGVGIDQDFYNGLNKDQQEQASAIQNDLIIKGLSDPDLDVKAMIDNLVPLAPGKAMASKRDSEMEPSSLSFNKFKPVQDVVNNLGKADEALNKGRRVDPSVKKIRVFDFDDTLARSNSKVIVINPDANIDIDMLDIIARRKFKKEFENLPSYKQSYSSLNEQQKLEVLKEIPGATTEINATQFAEQAADLEAQGATFDFSQFEQVIDGKKGPLFDVAKKIADTRGTEDLFVLTARPQSADGPIKEFMKALGIDIPLKNITGLGDGTAQAKARWIVDKAADGYNDFYFADDATKNAKAVKDVLSQLDVKSKVQQARASKRDTFDTVINDMIQDSSGIESYKTFSAAKARTVGRDKGRFDWLTMASSAEDFKGLLYRLLGNGKKGEAQYEFLKTNLIDPYNKAEDSITQAKISAANDFMALKEQFPGLPKTLETETGVGKFTYQHALRTYMWTQQGMSIPGLSKADARKLNKFITDDAKLQAFADQLISIQKGKPYPEPGKDWLGGNLTTDIIGGINKVNRAQYQQEWQENVDIIFSPENLNKMEAAYGTRWRKALENTLKRMKAGTNRLGYNDQTSAVLDWVNNSVGAVMFLNTRSALLQTISAVNFINWGDNNIIAAGKAFANQKQFWGDFMTLMNSDYLTQRRNGLKINVSESEIADAVKDSKNKVKAAIAFLLSKGFVLTRYADSFAIASGGATFYRNRMNKYVKEGMSQELAREKAFQDFRLVAEESQQSSSPDKISMQQASAAGRVILNWANTPMQYVRIQKRSIQDLIAGRGDAKTHISRIAYYGVVQNLIFNALQQALFAIGFGDDDDDEEKSAAKKKQDDKKIARVANGMIDSQLKGLGIAGMGMVAAKNSLMKIYEESGKNRSEYEKAAIEALSFSPAISSKYRKIVGGLKSFSWNMKEIKEKGFSLDNPAYLAGAQIITATTNIPIDRVIKKANNIRGIMSEQSQMWQKVSMALGWSSYDVGLPYYGGWDKPVEPTPAERKKQEIDVMKKDTSTADQTQMLLDLGLDKKQIKALRYEDARVKKIIELQNKKKDDKNKP